MKSLQLPAFRQLIAISLYLLSYNLFAAGTELAIFPLSAKPAQDLVETIKPLVGEQGSVTAFSNKLIIRAPSEQLEEIRWLISELDKPARNLLIEVNVGRKHFRNDNGIGLSTQFQNNQQNAQLLAHQASTQGRGTSQQQIRTLDGHAALIETGESIPIQQIEQTSFGRQTSQNYSVRYKEITRGFYALPRLNGNQVTLEIYQQSDHRALPKGQFNVQRASSVIHGKLGEWIELGSIGEQGRQKRSGLGYSISTQKNNQQTISLRVTEIP